MSGRKLHPDELELWAKVTQNTKELPKSLVASKPSITKQVVVSHETPKQGPHRVFKLTGARAQMQNDLAPDLSSAMANSPLQMDQKAFRKLRKGKLKPEGRIDLHGMTLDRAHTSLTRFVLSSHSSGKRLLLVITGKGKHRDTAGPIPVRHGVLRHQVPQWLRLAPLSSVVLQVTEAHISHGGGGAYYVYLRRSR